MRYIDKSALRANKAHRFLRCKPFGNVLFEEEPAYLAPACTDLLTDENTGRPFAPPTQLLHSLGELERSIDNIVVHDRDRVDTPVSAGLNQQRERDHRVR